MKLLDTVLFALLVEGQNKEEGGEKKVCKQRLL